MPKNRPPSRAGKRSGKTEFAYSVCATVKDGKPDMFNGIAKRVVTLDEAKSHGWSHFYDGEWTCPYGHKAARYVTNTYKCVDCSRIADGKLPIYGGRPNEDLISEAVNQIPLQDPTLKTDFRWHAENWRQFGVAYINNGSVEKALQLIGAQPYDLIIELRANPERAADFDALRADVDQVFLWKAEGSAVSGSDRTMLARASASFPDRFGKSQSGLDTQPYVNPDKAVAELAQLLRTAQQSLAERAALGKPRTSSPTVADPNTGAAPDAGGDVEETVLLGPPLDNSDLV